MKQIMYLTLAAYLGCISPIFSQNTAKNLTVDDLASWQRITRQEISDNGKWVACTVEPWEGDASVLLYSNKGKQTASFHPANEFYFSATSNYLLIKQSPEKSTVDSLKLLKTKKEKMPMNALVIYSMDGKQEVLDSIKTFKIAKHADWIAYQRGRKDSTLYIRSLDGNSRFSISSVSHFQFADKSCMLNYVRTDENNPGIYTIDPTNGKTKLIKEGKGIFKQITFDEKGEHLAFLYCNDKKISFKEMSLWLSSHNNPAKEIATREHTAFPAHWVINKNGKLHFSKSATRLFFGTSPEPKQKDTTQLEENRPNVQVWNWNEPVQYTVQEFNKERDLKKSYLAVYNLKNNSILQLANEELPDITLGNKGDAVIALLSTSRPYSLSSMWEGRTRNDYYTISLENGERKQIAEANYGRFRLSPNGNYAYWYGETDSCWYTIDLVKGKQYRLTTPKNFPAWDEDNDVPNYPQAHGAAGWTSDDKEILIYDRYDIWKFSPTNSFTPIKLTRDGRDKKIVYRLVTLNPDNRFIDLKQTQLLIGFNETTKGYGYYKALLTSPVLPQKLIAGDYMLRSIKKAKNSKEVIYTKENYQQYEYH